ncbi:MAG: leucine-rich repeat domain-containing protein [Paludibacteraceae bacterium]|nr:leucine-rich repeat domain-containing protein [Paludibacteraceae bacterium]
MAYYDQYGVRYSDDRKTLEFFPKDFSGKYVIPEGVTGLSMKVDDAYEDNGELFPYITEQYSPFNIITQEDKESLYEMGGLIKIVNCPKLTCIEFPESFTYLPENALKRCTGLHKLIFHAKTLYIGDHAFSQCKNLEEIIIDTKDVKFGQHVFSGTPYEKKCYIDGLFYFNDKLISVSPDFEGKCIVREGTRSIGKRAFENTSKISEVVLPESLIDLGVETFYCSGVQKISIPRGVTKLEDGGGMTEDDEWGPPSYSVCGVFYGCEHLQEVSLPDTLTYIGDGAFYGCKDLKQILLPKHLQEIGMYAFAYTALLKVHIYCTSIGIGAFACCDNLKSVEFDDSASAVVTHSRYYEMGCHMKHEKVFDECFAISQIKLPYNTSRFRDLFDDNLMSYGMWIDSLFYYQDILADVDEDNLPKTIQIKNGTKALAHDLHFGKNGEKVIIPSSVRYADITSVEERQVETDDSFNNSIEIEIIKEPFYNNNILFSYPLNNDLIIIDEGTQIIASYATSEEDKYVGGRYFDNEKAVRIIKLELPSTLKVIGEHAFSELGITSLRIPQNVEYIGNYAFSNCKNLTEIYIPNTIKYISPFAFWGCKNLKSTKVQSQCPSNIISMISNLIINVEQ